MKQMDGTLPMSQTMTDLKFKKSSQMPNRQVQQSQIQIEDFSESETETLHEILRPYLRDLYNDLIVRCIEPEAVTEKMLDRITFIDYMRVPIVLAERIFGMYDKPKVGLMNEAVFGQCMTRILVSNFQTTAKFCFKL
jgi:hypothetical protein